MLELLAYVLNYLWPDGFIQLAIVVAGVYVAGWLQRDRLEKRYDGWKVRLLHENGYTTITEHPLSATRAKQVLPDPSEMTVFLTTLLMPYINVTVSLVTEGEELGVYRLDNKAREICVHICPPYVLPKPSAISRQRPGFRLSNELKMSLKELVIDWENREPEAAYGEIENNPDRYGVCVDDAWSFMTIREYIGCMRPYAIHEFLVEESPGGNWRSLECKDLPGCREHPLADGHGQGSG